jgi:hypothetical protein
MLMVSLWYFLTEFAGLDYNLTGFTPGIMVPNFLRGIPDCACSKDKKPERKKET